MSKRQIICIGIGMVGVFVAVYVGITWYVSNIAESRVNEAIAKAADFADIDYRKVDVDLPWMDVRISGVLVSPVNADGKIKIEEVVIHDIDKKSDIPTFLSFSCSGIELDLGGLGDDSNIKALGYHDTIMINLHIDYTFDIQKKELAINDIRLGVDEAGTIRVGIHAGNINLKAEGIVGFLFTIPHIMLHEAQIQYEDDSLAERLIQLGARRRRTSAEEFKGTVMDEVEKAIEREKDDFTKKALVEIKKFIQDPHKFSIWASPSKPQPLGRLMRVSDPKDIIKLLNIRIQS
jgi:hypothetical protein